MIGKGNVGTALGAGLERSGHQVRYGHRDPNENVKAAAEWGEVIVLAVPFDQVGNVTKELGSLADGKPLIDVTNAIGPDGGMALGFSTSGAEELQKMLPKAKVVKAFNTVFAKNQRAGKVGSQQITAFVAGDDEEAKRTVMTLARDIGFDPVDSGPLQSARFLEPMAMHLIGLAYGLGMGPDIGYLLVKG